MRNSIYVKSILFFLLIFLISNTLMIVVFVNSFYNSINVSNEEYIIEYAETVKALYADGVEPHTIMDASNSRVRVRIYNTYELVDQYFTSRLSDKDIEDINAGEDVVVNDDMTFIAFKLGNKYCIIYPLIAEGPVTIALAVVSAGIITLTVAAFVVFLGVGTILQPLAQLSVAARKIAEGEYNVSIPVRNNNDTLAQLINDFNEMSKKLSETEMLRNDFVSGISHEFRTPIQSIYGYANLLKDETANPEHREYLSRICSEAERLKGLSANILQLNRLENISDSVEKLPYRLDEQIRQAVLMLESRWSAKSIEMDIDLATVTLCANENMIMQVLVNLLDNAVKFTPENGKISIKLTLEGNTAECSLTDSGAGFSPEDLSRLFEKFYKGDRSRGTSGNGLGLSIVKKILDLHGFSIAAGNAPSGGAEFRIQFKV